MFSLTTAPPQDIALQHLVLGICPSGDFQCTLNEAGHSILLSNNLTMCVERELSRHSPSIPVTRSPRRCALVRLIFPPLNTPFRFLEAEFVFFLHPVDFFLCVTALCYGAEVSRWYSRDRRYGGNNDCTTETKERRRRVRFTTPYMYR